MNNRLTNANRDAIRHTLLERKFGPAETILAQRSAKLFERAIICFWGVYWDAVKNIPEDLINQALQINIEHPKQGRLTLEGGFPLPQPGTHCRYLHKDEMKEKFSPSLRADINAFALDKDAHNEIRHQADRALAQALAAVSSYKKLYELWPELASVSQLVESRPAGTGQQLAVDFKELNKLLDLPA